jgi:APA family basic amino acid/polyamine antiporter
VGFAAYASAVLPPPRGWSSGVWQAGIAVCLILFLGLLNVAGTRLSGLVQVLGTILKSGAIVLMILLPWLFFSHVHFDYLRPALPSRWSWPVWQGMMAAMVPVLWSYGGWDQLSHMAEEVRNPDRNLPRAFGFGLAFIAVLYAGAAVAIQLVFPIPQIAKSQAIGSDFFRALLSAPGVALITVVVMFSAVTSAHMALMSGSRSCFAIARGKLFPQALARLHPRFDTPANAITAITIWSCLLVAGNAMFRVGSRPLYVVLISYVMFALLLFGALICFAAIRLRIRHPEWKRPYRAWGYPVTPIASILVTAFLLITMLTTSPWESCSALAVILLGWPVYLGARKNAD